VTNARLQVPCGFLLYTESVEVAGKRVVRPADFAERKKYWRRGWESLPLQSIRDRSIQQRQRGGTLGESFPAQTSGLRTSVIPGSVRRWARATGLLRAWCRLLFSRAKISEARRARPVRGKYRSPPDRNNWFSRTNFLPTYCGRRCYAIISTLHNPDILTLQLHLRLSPLTCLLSQPKMCD